MNTAEKERNKRLREVKKENARRYRALKKEKKRKIPESEYLTRMKNPDNILEIDNLHTFFYTDVGTVRAIDGVTFEVPRGKTVGIVGESGCGKSVTSLSVMRILQEPQGQITGGEIRFNQRKENRAINLAKTPQKVMEKVRGGEISMIFQEPMTTLNPVFTIGRQLDEAVELHSENSGEAGGFGPGQAEDEILPRDAGAQVAHQRFVGQKVDQPRQDQQVGALGVRGHRHHEGQVHRAVVRRAPVHAAAQGQRRHAGRRHPRAGRMGQGDAPADGGAAAGGLPLEDGVVVGGAVGDDAV